VFENRVLKSIFASKRDELAGQWRRQYKEEPNDMYCPPNVFG
jgi:hypothetical protein